MIRPEQVLLYVEPVDMRWGADRLSRVIQELSGRSPCAGAAFGFTNRSQSRIKLLLWDGTGVWLCQRRLHQGGFRWPRDGEELFVMTAEQWRWLIAGVEWQRLCAVPQKDWCV